MTPSDPELTVALVDSDVRDAERVTAMTDDHTCGWKTSAGKRRWTGATRSTRTVSGGAPPWSRPTSSRTGC